MSETNVQWLYGFINGVCITGLGYVLIKWVVPLWRRLKRVG
jgi:hypothetical protein